MTTQYLEEADQLCDRLAVLEDGEIIAEGTPNSLKAAVGTETLTVTFEQPTTRQKRRAIEEIRAVQTLDCATVESTPSGLAVHATDASQAAPSVFEVLTDAGVAVSAFDIESPTLDDVFLSLAGNDEETAVESETNRTHIPTQEVAR